MSAELVTLAEAKSHLRIKGTALDSDVQMKYRQASDIVIDYLKRRAHRTATVASSSVANPTVITTDAEHGFLNGETAILDGHEDSTPALDGVYAISNVTPLTFTVPVNVTAAGTGGTATVEWTPATVPKRIQAATLLVLEDLHEHRPIDWDAIRRLLERSRDPAYA